MALGRTVAELEQTLGMSELLEWFQYYKQEPWGAIRDNIHAGLIAATFANAHRKKGTEPFTFEDFLILDRESQATRKTMKTLSALSALAKRKKDGN